MISRGARRASVTGRRTRARRAAGLGTPLLVVPPALIGVAFLLLPTVALLVRMPWGSLGRIYRGQHIWTALRLSIESSLEATAISLVIGVPLAWVIARVRLPGMGLVRALVIVPLVLPPVMGGLALFAAFGHFGLLGSAIRALTDGSDLPFTYAAIVVAQTFVSMPFLVLTVEGAFRIADRGVEEAAATLGASRTRVLLRVTLPLVAPAIVVGAVLCWARALGEFGATLLFGGNTVGTSQTVPTAVLTVYATNSADAPALALPLLAVALIVLISLRDRWLRAPAAS
ncbi:molybdate ABC transporter permease subunit [uncultured Jatrophihabitans sp.]|uniref:molybdate ABC transporter permease subunit n=1 Tax=uncultured Jatrophihabitans sp. TaxID=1610747 RepID=UPI0035CC7E84